MSNTAQSEAAVGISHSIDQITTILASVSATSFYLKGEDIMGTDLLSRDAHKRLDKIKTKLRESNAHQLVTSDVSEENTTIFIEKEVRAHTKKYIEAIKSHRGGRNVPKGATVYRKPRVYIDQAIDYLEVEMRRYGFAHSVKAQSGPQWVWNASYCQYCYWWEQEMLWVFEDGKQVPPGGAEEPKPAAVKDKGGKGAD